MDTVPTELRLLGMSAAGGPVPTSQVVLPV
ncbi:hypothetical protein SAMN05444149_10520 [Pseudosulfitobacter pseudonitzschiae]|nr:hypothetical protein SAMN05444149_10520 [Pseudosulfitobacter pseudonitzschiae]